MPDAPSRREADRRLDMLIDQAREDRQEAREWRTQAMIKLESIPVMMIGQASQDKRLDGHDERFGRLEPRVETTEQRMDRAKWTLIGAFGSGGVLGAGGTKALLAWLAGFGH